uniref:complement C3-like isoform X2 n=1 Tax=Scatophagus argus TaxID=75038 RepID=UPI001ED80E56|nr:complement C3-like isoform X2 [Scatophagus argus]
MDSGRRICETQLWLLAFLAFSSPTHGSQLEVMSAPNLLRVGSAENIFVEIQDRTLEENINVEIIVMNHPTKAFRLASTSVTLTKRNNFQDFGQITIPPQEFSKDPNMKQYVYLQAQFPGRVLEKVVLVSFQAGYIFIQTDKTLYTPDSKVYYRMFALTPAMESVERDTHDQAGQIVIDIVTPEGIILALDKVSLNSRFYSGHYQLGETASPGLWKVVAKFYNNPQQSFAAEFEVKKYMLPSFEVTLTSVSPFFYVDSEAFTVYIRATYLFGEEVDGTAYVVFGVIHQDQKNNFSSSLQRVQIRTGRGAVTLRREHITQTFKTILDLVGSSIFVAVTVMTDSGGEIAEAELRNIKIVTSPYTVHFKKSPKYFKPGMSFDTVVEVLNPDDTPAQGVEVVINPGQVRSRTAANGVARVTINIEPRTDTLTITAKTNDPLISSERQASATMLALPHITKSNSYIHIVVDTAEVELGQNLRIYGFLNRQENSQSDITYVILSRGQLVKYGRYKTRGQALIFLTIPITKEMLPSFRIVAYYHTNDNEVVADSVWVDVKDSCMGSLKLESTRYVSSYGPRRMFGLKVTGDPGATVGLVAVDNGVYVLNNKHRLTQKKVWDIVEKFDTGCTTGGGRDSMNVFYDAGLLFQSSAFGTPHRRDFNCPGPSRRKRSIFDEEDEMMYMDSNEIISRTSFPDSWLWSDIQLPSCPVRNPNCDTTSFVTNLPLKDSMTTRQITGISLSRTHGICVADPLEVIVRKEFFIDLRLPYSAVHGEQLEIKAILHNYSPDPIIVRVDLLEEEHVCSAASRRGKYRQEVKVGPQTTRSVPFIIIPMKEGHFRVEVKAAVKDSLLSDGVMKMLRVLPAGVLTKSILILTLDPTNKGVGGQQQEIINSGIPLKDLLPNTPVKTIISLTGREQINAVVENVISGKSMDSLIRQPSGPGEANVALMTLPVIATIYLDKTNQWATVGFEKRNDALQYIKTGYRNELAFRKNDGSFAVFSSHQSSTWLTAYVAKVFSMANSLVPIQHSVICDATKFLVLNAQQSDGMFREVGRVFNGQMTGDVRGTDSDASMTAFCLIAMQESRTLCAATVNSLQSSIDKAVSYLETRLPHLTNPYAVTMTSYALANENKLNQEILYKFASPALSHWPSPKGHVYTLEATAYALLALVKAKAFEEARHVVRWFTQQQRVGGGFGSTQATIMVYQAVAEYWATAKEPEYDLNVDILLPGRLKPDKYNFNRENHYATRTSKFSDINKDVKVTATGTGEAMMKMVSMYYTLPQEKESDCQKFNLSVKLLPETFNEDEKIFMLRIEILYKDKERDATMSVLDIGLLTGFTVNTNDLDLLSRGRDRVISKYEMNTVLSERGSLIIYLDKVSHTRPEEITFRVHQKLKVGVLQPAAVSVYEYYDQSHCVKFYHPERTSGELLRLCRNDECTCAEENCSMQKMGKIDNDERTAKANEVTPNGRIDFVYKVRVENFTNALSTDIYTVRIVEVIKEGSYDVSLLGKLCSLLSFVHCRAALNLRRDKTYLIMGSSKEIHKDKQTQSYQYVLGERTWIEYWPTEAECQTEERRPTCLGLEELKQQYEIFGCRHQLKENCSVQRMGEISNDERIAKADEVTPNGRIDFVYKVRVEKFSHGLFTDIYTVRIVEVMKEGGNDVSLLDKLCNFLSYPNCREALYLGRGKTYLIMGSSKEINKDKQTQSYQYMLSERTWIEYWPTEAECQTEEHRPTCLGMEELVKHTLFECLCA